MKKKKTKLVLNKLVVKPLTKTDQVDVAGGRGTAGYPPQSDDGCSVGCSLGCA